MRVRIIRNGAVVNTVDVKTTSKDSKFDILRRIEVMQQTEDVLKTGMLGNVELGINAIHCQKGVWQVSEDNKGTYKFDGVERNLKFDIRMYEPGFVLYTGRRGTNLLGMTFQSYLRKLTRAKIRCSQKDSAKVFPTLKALKSFIEKNQSALEYLVKNYGYEWSIEDASPLSAEDYQKSLSEMSAKKREKEVALKQELENLLNQINRAEEESRMPTEIPDEITADVMKAEALRRMQLLNMWENVVNDFTKDGTVYMSEGGGIIYDLDETAKKVVEKVRADEKMPYAVIHEQANIGELYVVLYVGKNGDGWKDEIPTAKGWLMGYVYNVTYEESSEFGSVQVIPANGGLVRVA